MWTKLLTWFITRPGFSYTPIWIVIVTYKYIPGYILWNKIIIVILFIRLSCLVFKLLVIWMVIYGVTWIIFFSIAMNCKYWNFKKSEDESQWSGVLGLRVWEWNGLVWWGFWSSLMRVLIVFCFICILFFDGVYRFSYVILFFYFFKKNCSAANSWPRGALFFYVEENN